MRWLVLLAAILQIVTAWLPSGVGVGLNVAARSAPVNTPATPAGYAFAIWGLIYLLDLAFAVFQALPGRRREPLLIEARGPALAMFAANAAWSLYVQLAAIDLVSVVIIVLGFAAGLTVMLRLRRFAPGPMSAGSLLAKTPLALTAGWVSVAAFANIAAVLAGYRLVPAQLGEAGVAVILVAAAGLLVAWVTRAARANLAYPLAAIWGLIAIAVAGSQVSALDPVTFTAGAASLLVLATAALNGLALVRARA